jgi:hypothetical protein
MQLNLKQISRIRQKVVLDQEKLIIRIEPEQEGWTFEETRFNIYCVDKWYNIIWQVQEEEEYRFEDGDPFCYLGQKRRRNYSRSFFRLCISH